MYWINCAADIHRNDFIFCIVNFLNFVCSTTENRELDELILKFITRFRINGGFFLALKEPQDRRQHLLQRLTNSILTNKENAQKANLTPAEIHQ
jgi:hypothetical protein